MRKISLRTAVFILLGTGAAAAGLIACACPWLLPFGVRDDSRVPGTVVDHIPARSGQFFGSPSIAILPNGGYVISHDFSGLGSPKPRTAVFLSCDRGKTWEQIAEIPGQFWSSLFVHQGKLYLMGTSRGMGDVVIRRSDDGGKTWTVPRDAQSGLLLSGHYHTAPVPVVVHQGRIWRAMEEHHPRNRLSNWLFGRLFGAFVMSAPVGADLLNAASWTATDRLLPGERSIRGWLEGNVVITPDGNLANILRVDSTTMPERAAILPVASEEKLARFDPAADLVTFPGGSKKFTIRYDPQTKLYWTLTNAIPQKPAFRFPSRVRNTLALASSPDLRKWDVNAIILHHPDPGRHAFQYADWVFDGDGILFVSRTAYDDGLGGAVRQHDANYVTFHRIADFRKYRLQKAPEN